MDRVEKLRKKGLNITSDMIVYTTGPGLLCNILPQWVFEGGTQRRLRG